MTGHQGAFHSGEMIKFGTNVVAGVSPGKAGTKVNGVDYYPCFLIYYNHFIQPPVFLTAP